MENDRRNFLKLVMAATVTTVACPHIVLGKLTPEIKDNGDNITGIYQVKISDYPVLKNIWGGVRLDVSCFDPNIHYPKIIVTCAPNDNDDGFHFTCVTEQCPHEGYPVELFNEDTMIFLCKKGHQSQYDITGKYVRGISNHDLQLYNLTYNGGDNIYIEIDGMTPCNINDVGESSLPDAVLTDCIPNPCSEYTKITYFAAKPVQIELSLFNAKGAKVKDIYKGFTDTGSYDLRLDVSNLPSGTYIYKLLSGGKSTVSKKLQIVR